MAKQITTTQAGERLGITRHRVTHLIADGRLKAEKIGRDWLIDERSLKAVENRRAGRPRLKNTRAQK